MFPVIRKQVKQFIHSFFYINISIIIIHTYLVCLFISPIWLHKNLEHWSTLPLISFTLDAMSLVVSIVLRVRGEGLHLFFCVVFLGLCLDYCMVGRSKHGPL